MKIIDTAIPDVKEIAPQVFADDRGYFMESFNATKFAAAIPGDWKFLQDNHSHSRHGVVRGLHYQIQHSQGKLVRVVEGEVFDVVVDMRRSSPTFGKSASVLLSAAAHNMLWVPPGFAHGFMALSESVTFLYKTTDYWAPAHERTLLWNDPALKIDWPLARLRHAPVVNAKDVAGAPFAQAESFA
jgi:dTDP-4-dehydrorhamnose 3,5-epimerase